MAKRTRWILGIGLLAAILIGPGLVQYTQLSLRERALDRRLAELRARNKRLVEERRRLETDSVYVEGLIRTTFKQALPGEYVIPLDELRE